MTTVPQLFAPGQVAPPPQRLRLDGFDVEISDEPRIRDIDLGTRLGFDRPRDVRKLIDRWRPELGAVHVRATVARTTIPGKNEVSRNIEETWLTREQATFIVAKSETPAAVKILKEVIDVFWRAMDHGIGHRDTKPANVADPIDAFLEEQLRAACSSPRLGCPCVRCAGLSSRALLVGLGAQVSQGFAVSAALELRRRGWTRGNQRRQGARVVRPWFPPAGAPAPLPSAPPLRALAPAPSLFERRFPNLVSALAWARDAGALSEACEEVMWRMALAAEGVDLSRETWALILANLSRAMPSSTAQLAA